MFEPTLPRKLLFLCTGNYYRSRFAEMYFNHLAAARRLAWRAESRGLATETNHLLPGVISQATVAGLVLRGVPLPHPHREPIACRADDFGRFELVIALKEAEHRPLMRQRFPAWEQRVEYWHIHDVDCSPPEATLAELEQLVRALVSRLSAQVSPD